MKLGVLTLTVVPKEHITPELKDVLNTIEKHPETYAMKIVLRLKITIFLIIADNLPNCYHIQSLQA